MKTGKKRFIGVFAAMFLLIFAAACVFGGCGSKKEDATVESVSVSPASLELTLDSSGEASGTVTATVKMSDSSNYTGDITVGAVSGVSYTVSPMSGSSATIIVTATEPVSATSVSVSAGGKSASFTLTVNAYETGTPEPNPEPGTEDSYAVTVTSENNVTEVEVESTLLLTASVTNNGADVKGAIVTWSQSSEGGGEVSFDETTPGLITGVTAGTVTITATYTPEGGEAVSGSITVTVKAVTPEPGSGTEDSYAVEVTSENSVKEVEVEGSLQLTATVTNNETPVSGATVEWTQTSTDDGAVDFDSTTSGLITGVAAGTVTITATYTPEGGTAVFGSITITVTAKEVPQPETPTVTGVTLSGEALVDGTVTMTLADGTASAEITATVVMSEGSYEGEAPQATCEESNLTVTMGEQNTDGTYTITITASGEVAGTQVKVSIGSVEATFTVTVNAEPAESHEHTFVDAQPSVDWTSFDAASDKTSVQVTYTCTDDECDQSEGYTVTITATVTSVDTPATCTEDAYTTYTASWNDSGFSGNDTHVVTYENTKGHVYSSGSEVTWTWTLDTQNGGYLVTAVVKCDNCDETVNATVSVTYDEDNIRYTATATIEGVEGMTYTDILQERAALAGSDVTWNGATYKANSGLIVTVTENSNGEKVYEVSGAAYGLTEEQLANFAGAALGDAYVAVRFYVGYGETLNYGWDGETFTKTTGQNPYENDPWGTIIIHVTNGGAVKFQLVKADGTSEIFWISFENLTYNDITVEASSASVSVEVGKEETLSVTVKKNGVDITDSVTLEWTITSGENLVSIENGVVTAGNTEGTATITVTYTYGEDSGSICITVDVVSGDQKEAEERLTAVTESINFNGATFTNQTDVSFVFDSKSETPNETYGYYYVYMHAEGTASSMNAAQVAAFDPNVSLHTPYVVLTITLNPGETVSYKSGRSVTNNTNDVDYDVIVLSITNYAYYQFKITSENDSVGTMYVVDFSEMTRAAGHAYPETSEGLTWNWEGRDTESKTVEVSFVCDDHTVFVTAAYTLDETTGLMTATAVFDEEHSYTGTWNLSTVETAEGLVNAFAESETEIKITLTADIKDAEGSTAVYDAFYWTFYHDYDTRTVTVDLGTHTLDLSSDIYTFIIIGNDVTFTNGTLILPDVSKWDDEKWGAYQAGYDTYSTWGILEVQSGSLTLDGITIEGICGTAVFVDGDGAKATITNSTITTTGAYGVGTNAKDPYDCEIYISGSTITAHSQNGDGTGVFMNVPGKLTIVNSTIEGDIQAVVARGGEVSISGTTLKLSGNYVAGTGTAENLYSEDYEDEVAWGGGNNLPYAALVLGNNYEGDSYQYATTATLDGVTFDIGAASKAWAIYAYSYNSTCTVSVTLESGWTYTSGLEYIGITYLDEEATLPVYCGISGEGSIAVGGTPLDVFPYVTGVSLDETEYTLDLNGNLEFALTAIVTMSDGGTYEGEYVWSYAVTEGDEVITTSGSGVVLTIMAVSVGTVTVTVTVEGYTASCVVTVVDTTPEESDVLASISVDFSDSETYSWIDFTDGKTSYSSEEDALLTAYSRSSGNAWASSKEGTAMRTNGATASSAGYFSVNLSAYVGNYVTVYVDMANTGNNEERALFLSSSASTTAVGENVYAYAPSVTDSYHTTTSYTLYIEEDTELYITWSGSIDIYKIEVTILTDAELAPAVESVAIDNSERSFVYDQTAEESATSNLSATVTTESGTYTGGYYWSSSDTGVITVEGDGNTATISIVGAGEATITVTLCNAPMKSASCVITVVQKYTVSITGVPESALSINLGETGSITLGVEILTNEGTALDASEYDIAVQIDDTNVATFAWDTSTGVITVTPANAGRTYISIIVSVNNVILATAECNITIVDPDAEVTDVTYSMHYTIGSTWFETTSLLPDNESDQVTFKYSDSSGYTSSDNLKSISVTYTDDEGNTYDYTRGLRLKGFNSRDVIITIPDSAYDVTIKLVIDCNTDVSDNGTRVASLTGDSSTNVLGSTSGLSKKGELDVIEVSGLTAGEYHVIADNDLYLMGIFITYTVTAGAGDIEDPGTEIPDDPSQGETPSTEGSIIVVFNPDSDGSTFSQAAEQGFTVSSGSSTSVSYTAPDGVTYSKALKMESNTSVKFTTTEECTITLYLVPKTTGSTIKVKIDGQSYTVDSDGYVTTTLAIGEHEISKETTNTYLCYAVLTPTSV